MKKFIISAAALLVAIGVAIPASAFASHFRSSYGSVSVSGSTLTWTLDEAWRKGSNSDIGTPNVLTVPNPTAAPVTPVNGGTPAGYTVTSAVPVYDDTNPLYSTTTETHQLDLSTITADGTYEMFASSCCRVSGVQNTNSNRSFSQWIRFTKTGGTYNLPPNFNNPSLYKVITPGAATSADFTAADPEGGAVTYTAITDTEGPYYGSQTLACSSLVNGLLTLDPSLCAGADVFANIYTPGSYWTTKVLASDAQGNTATVDTLFRVMTAPAPRITNAVPTGNGLDYQFTVIAPDTLVDSFTTTCTNDIDPTNVVTGTSATSVFTMGRFINGASYACDVTATNAAGTGTNAQQYAVGPMALVGVNLDLHLAVGATFKGATSVISGSGLKAGSNYDLTLHSDPIIIDQGVTDVSGNFTNTIRIPADACLVGVHRLILTGVDPSGNPVSDTQWIELGSNCTVLQLSQTEIIPPPALASPPPALVSLPNTGVNPSMVGTSLAVSSGLLAAGALTMILVRRRRNH
jgi:LPXTG-motif cell wall-anchored protein